MNYIQLINQYWELQREREDFTAQVQLLYFALLYFANKAGWKSFSVYREDVLKMANISKKSYYPARDILKNCGLIHFDEGATNTKKCKFQVCELSSQGDNAEDNRVDKKQRLSSQGDNKVDITGDNAEDHTTKPINLETNKLSDKEVSEASPSSAPVEKSDGENLSFENSDSLNAEKKASQTGGRAADEVQPPNFHRLFTDTYCEFYKNRVGVSPRFTKTDGIAAAALREYLKSQCRGQTDDGAQKTLQYIFHHWNRLEPFLQNQLTLTQINKNINNILNQVKNGAAKNTSGTRAANGSVCDVETNVAMSRAIVGD